MRGDRPASHARVPPFTRRPPVPRLATMVAAALSAKTALAGTRVVRRRGEGAPATAGAILVPPRGWIGGWGPGERRARPPPTPPTPFVGASSPLAPGRLQVAKTASRSSSARSSSAVVSCCPRRFCRGRRWRPPTAHPPPPPRRAQAGGARRACAVGTWRAVAQVP